MALHRTAAVTKMNTTGYSYSNLYCTMKAIAQLELGEAETYDCLNVYLRSINSCRGGAGDACGEQVGNES